MVKYVGKELFTLGSIYTSGFACLGKSKLATVWVSYPQRSSESKRFPHYATGFGRICR